MLKVWVKYPKDKNKVVGSALDLLFDTSMDDDLILTDMGRLIVKDISKVAEIHNCHAFTTEWGFDISKANLAGGAKMLLLMMCKNIRDTGRIFDYAYCGDNCNKYLEILASQYDINIYLGRCYIPSQGYLEKYGAEFVESGVIVWNEGDFFHQYCVIGKE